MRLRIHISLKKVDYKTPNMKLEPSEAEEIEK